MTFGLDTMDFALRVLQILVIPATVWVWRSFARVDKELEVLRAQLANRTAEIKAGMAEDLGKLRERLSTAEARLNDVPSGGALHDLAISIERLRGDVKAVVERLTGVDRVVERMDKILSRQEDYLLKNGGK